MRQGNGRRPRGRPNRKPQHGGPQRSNSFDSGGPEGRIRGNANQVYEKYVALARDALSSDDRVMAETYFQHAEHYFRIVNASTDPQPNGQGQAKPAQEQPRHQGGNGHAGDGAVETQDQGSRNQGGPDQNAQAQSAPPQDGPQRHEGTNRRRQSRRPDQRRDQATPPGAENGAPTSADCSPEAQPETQPKAMKADIKPSAPKATGSPGDEILES